MELSDYHVIEGGPVAMHISGSFEGQTLLDYTLIDVQFFPYLNDDTFAPPEAAGRCQEPREGTRLHQPRQRG
jgi:hypothetical protein